MGAFKVEGHSLDEDGTIEEYYVVHEGYEITLPAVEITVLKEMSHSHGKKSKKKNEGVLDFLSKDKREKRKKVKARAQNISNIRKSKEQEIKRMDSLAMKFASPRGGSDEEKKELAKLRSKYSDLIKKRQDRMNKKRT